MTFNDIKQGDVVTRMLAGVVPMELRVTKVTEDRIVCGWWEFDRKSGFEIDDDIPGAIVSYLVPLKETVDD